MAWLRMSPVAIVPSPAEPQTAIWMSVLMIGRMVGRYPSLVIVPKRRVQLAVAGDAQGFFDKRAERLVASGHVAGGDLAHRLDVPATVVEAIGVVLGAPDLAHVAGGPDVRIGGAQLGIDHQTALDVDARAGDEVERRRQTVERHD